MKLFLLSLLVILLPSSDSFYAKVVGIQDGDSIVILTEDNLQLKIRLEGIDCPELYQDFGQNAKQATTALCFNKKVRIKKSGVDRYGRTLAYVYVGSLCINNELLRQGMAWHYKEYNHDLALAELEEVAHKKKIGLWSQPEPVSPWDWRCKK